MESRRLIVLLFNCAALGIGAVAGPLLLRFYFVHGGTRRWFSCWLQTAGFPILILPLSFSYTKHNSTITRALCLCCIGLGLLTGIINFMYTWGLSYLPVSTAILLFATQLGFNAIFAFLLVRHKFTPFSVNAVILLVMGPILISFESSSDRPPGITNSRYYLAFAITIGSAVLSGLISPLVEFIIKKTTRTIVTYRLVMEMQFIMSFTATVFSTVGMAVNKDFQAISREAKAFDAGEINYYMAVVWSAIVWQLSFIGIFGVIFLSSSLFSGLLVAIFFPVTEVLAVVFFHEKFSGIKGMAVAMAVWGFASYLYGEYKGSKVEVNNMHIAENGESASLRREEETDLELATVEQNLQGKEETALDLE